MFARDFQKMEEKSLEAEALNFDPKTVVWHGSGVNMDFRHSNQVSDTTRCRYVEESQHHRC